MNLFFSVNDLISGTFRISDKKKYSYMALGTILIHFTMIFVFNYIGSLPLVIYNIISTLCYALCFVLIQKDILEFAFVFVSFEVPVFAFISTYSAGWSYGFAMYLIAIVPVCFDMAFALKDKNKAIKNAFACGMFSFAMFFGCRIYSYMHEPLYTVENEFFSHAMYIFNMFWTFMLLIFYTVMFISEINSAQITLEQTNRELNALASTDTLTGFYNRRKMHEFLDDAVESNSEFSLIMSDIDNFKHLNDTYGHDCGDEALRTICNIIRDHIPEDDKICRWGGEEFLILTKNAIAPASAIAEDIRAAVESRPVVFDGQEIKVTITLGVEQYDAASTIDKAITSADKKLYTGKQSGKNRVVS